MSLYFLQLFVPHDFKPCCLATKGDCLLTSHKHCVVLGGVWHIAEYEHCSQARCDEHLCQVYESQRHKVYNANISLTNN